ncbi:hypothetical protein TNCT_393041 [Trichonephila clavata]|uniref:Uncharacterized protein n=1 Tax=Trichonephila clavata TaxID=2740835 RepID=A0A8X6GGK6_TRICU|nr:hypothetical protein TNCT_393041 [Trichonephila clavata]
MRQSFVEFEFPKYQNLSKEGYSECLVVVKWFDSLLSFLKLDKGITVDQYCNEIDEICQKLAHKHPALDKASFFSPAMLDGVFQ